MKDYLMITPTASERTVRFADFPTLTQALDFAATGETGVNLYSLRGELVEAIPYAKLREDALVLARRLLATGAKVGDSVALLAETDADFIRAFFACQYAGLMPAPLPLPTPLGRPRGLCRADRPDAGPVGPGLDPCSGPPPTPEWTARGGEIRRTRGHREFAGRR